MKAHFCFLTLLLISPLSHAGDRVALVIGNDNYEHARKLRTAVSDASAVAAALKKLDFKVLPVTNASVETMLESLGKVAEMAKGADAVLVYYAGHGIESGGVNYLVPVDAKLEREVQLRTQTVSMDTVLEELKKINVPARMVVLDCCRDNPIEGRSWLATRSTGGGLAPLAQDTLNEATLVVYSASPGKPALDRVNDTDLNSPFTTALLEQLPKPGLHSFEMFGQVEDAVLERTGGRQAPRLYYNGSTQPFRTFRFANVGPSAVTQLPLVPPPPVAPELTPAPTTVAPQPAAMPTPEISDLNTLFTASPYSAYNKYSRGIILKRAQEALKVSGKYAGSPDGEPGPKTQSAVQAWQQDNGLPVTGRLDEATLKALGLSGISESQPPAPRPQKPQSSPPRPKPSRPARDNFFKDT